MSTQLSTPVNRQSAEACPAARTSRHGLTALRAKGAGAGGNAGMAETGKNHKLTAGT